MTGLLILLLLLAGMACRQTAPISPEGIDLLDLLPPELELGGPGPVGAKPIRWSMAGGLPAGWRTGPDDARVEAVDGGLRISTEASAWLEISINIDALRYEMLEVVFGEGQGAAAELYYSFSDPPHYNLGSRSTSKLVSEAGDDRYRFRLPHPDGAERPLRSFRLYPGGRAGGTVTVQTVTLVPRRPRFLKQAVLSRDRIELNQEYRRCWRISGNGERRVDITVPRDGALLQFSSGTLLGGGESRLRVTASVLDRPEKELFSVHPGKVGEGWTDHRVDLSPWAGRNLTLRFMVDSQEGSRAIRLIGAPVVRVRDRRKRPNVVLLVVDTLRADRLSAHGHPRRFSPHLDRLARQGLLFSEARAPSSWTIPSTAALITGRHPAGPGAEQGDVPAVDPVSVTLAERFSSQGYATGGFSANYVLEGSRGFDRGFETWYVAPFKDTHLTARQLNRRALAWTGAQQENPFFLYLQYMDPHGPYDAPTPEHPRGKAARPFHIDWGHRWKDGNILPLVMGWTRLGSREAFEQLEGYYHEEVTYVDHALGRLLAALRAAGQLEDAVVLVTADHGEELFDHGHWSHGYSLHRELVHVPMILSAPGLDGREGTVVTTPVSLLDAAPTLAALAGLAEDPGQTDGLNLLEASPPGRTFFAVTSAFGVPSRYSVFDGRYAYMRFDRAAVSLDSPGKSMAAVWLAHVDPPAEALYDTLADPLERENLVERYPELVSRLLAALEARYPQVQEAGDARLPETADLERLRALGYVE